MIRAEQIWDISIHALREEGDPAYPHPACPNQGFLSTPSARRATPRVLFHNGFIGQFLSTPSARRATFGGFLAFFLNGISIHALREEGDPSADWYGVEPNNFYPRPPRGGRQQKQRQNLYFLINYTTFCTNLEEP